MHDHWTWLSSGAFAGLFFRRRVPVFGDFGEQLVTVELVSLVL